MEHTSLFGLQGYVLLNIASDKDPLWGKMAKNGVKQPRKIDQTISYFQTANQLASLTNYCFSPFFPNCHAWSQASLSRV